jgi:hypothetical protein
MKGEVEGLTAVSATRPTKPKRLHQFGLADAIAVVGDTRPATEVWIVAVAGALVLPIWAVAVLAPALQVAGGLVRRDGTWRRWRPVVMAAAAGAAATAAAGAVLDGAPATDTRIALAGLVAACTALVIGRIGASRRPTASRRRHGRLGRRRGRWPLALRPVARAVRDPAR